MKLIEIFAIKLVLATLSFIMELIQTLTRLHGLTEKKLIAAHKHKYYTDVTSSSKRHLMIILIND